jgi:hypothetical protein
MVAVQGPDFWPTPYTYIHPDYMVHFLKTGFTSQMDFTVLQWSVTSSGLLCNNQFCFQSNAVKANHIEKVCNVYAPISAECKTTNAGCIKSAFTIQFDGDKQWNNGGKQVKI